MQILSTLNSQAPLISRRSILIGIVGYPLASCTSIDSCGPSDDPRARFECRGQAVNTATAITLATIIGAAAGYAIATGAGGDGATGAALGAVVGAGVSASIAYANYLLKKANQDRIAAMHYMADDVVEDIGYQRRTFTELNRQAEQGLEEAYRIQRGTGSGTRTLAEQADRLASIGTNLKKRSRELDFLAEAGNEYPAAGREVAAGRTDPPIKKPYDLVLEGSVVLIRETKAQANTSFQHLQEMYKLGVYI